MMVKTYKVGPLATNCYFVKDEKSKDFFIVDPAGISKSLDEEIMANPDHFKYILITHGHFDHIRKVQRYQQLPQKVSLPKIVMPRQEVEFIKDASLNVAPKNMANRMEEFTPDILVCDGDLIELGELKIKVIGTPGHTKGGVCYLMGNNLFSGDTLFNASVGRTDLKTGNAEELEKSLKKLKELKGDYKVYPGHGLHSTLQQERDGNSFLIDL